MSHKVRPEGHRRLSPEERRRFQEPEKMLELIDTFPGMKVADVGCGAGFFTFKLANRLAGGELWAVDVSPEVLAQLKEEIGDQGGENISPLLSQEDAIPLADGCLDGVLCTQVLHEADHRELFVKELARVLKPGGRLFLSDWRPQPMPFGPPIEERVAEEEVEALLFRAGFEDVRRHELYLYHYVFSARKGAGQSWPP